MNDYDEGTIDESMFIFFCCDPVLYKRALLKSRATDRWQQLGAFLCNHLRENGTPVEIRHPLREGILTMVSEKEIRDEFVDVIKEVKNCDVSSNLFD